MPSGERIQFGPNVNFLFETHDLSCDSPATISRMGMIFLRYDIHHTHIHTHTCTYTHTHTHAHTHTFTHIIVCTHYSIFSSLIQ